MKTEKTVRLGSEEQVGFDRFAKEHYQEAIEKAFIIAKAAGYAHPDGRIEAESEIGFAIAVFDKLASPLVYLKAAWRNELTDTQRTAFYPDAEQRAEKGRRIAEEAKAMINQ